MFDHRTHFKNKEGKTIRTAPYRLRVSQEYGSIYERPIYSGNCYYPDGSPVTDPKATSWFQKEKLAHEEKQPKKISFEEEKARIRAEVKRELEAEMKEELRKEDVQEIAEAQSSVVEEVIEPVQEVAEEVVSDPVEDEDISKFLVEDENDVA